MEPGAHRGEGRQGRALAERAEIVEYAFDSDDWLTRVGRSKFAKWPEYAKARSGHIGLQDHGDPVWYRDIKIRVLD